VVAWNYSFSAIVGCNFLGKSRKPAKGENPQTAQDTKTEKPQFLSAKTEKPNQKLAKSANPKIPTLLSMKRLRIFLESLRQSSDIFGNFRNRSCDHRTILESLRKIVENVAISMSI